MSVEDKLHRLVIARDNIRTALEGQGIDASNHGFEGFAEDIGDIEKLSDVDVVAFGDNPTLPDKGKTNPANYEAIADAINAARARPNAVTLESLNVTENGVYPAPPGKAYSPVTVGVQPNLQDKTVDIYETPTTEEVTPDSGYDGLGTVTVNVNAIVPVIYRAPKVVNNHEVIYDFGSLVEYCFIGYMPYTTTSKSVELLLSFDPPYVYNKKTGTLINGAFDGSGYHFPLDEISADDFPPYLCAITPD